MGAWVGVRGAVPRLLTLCFRCATFLQCLGSSVLCAVVLKHWCFVCLVFGVSGLDVSGEEGGALVTVGLLRAVGRRWVLAGVFGRE